MPATIAPLAAPPACSTRVRLVATAWQEQEAQSATDSAIPGAFPAAWLVARRTKLQHAHMNTPPLTECPCARVPASACVVTQVLLHRRQYQCATTPVLRPVVLLRCRISCPCGCATRLLQRQPSVGVTDVTSARRCWLLRGVLNDLRWRCVLQRDRVSRGQFLRVRSAVPLSSRLLRRDTATGHRYLLWPVPCWQVCCCLRAACVGWERAGRRLTRL